MKASILIHPSELSRSWIDRMADNGIDTLGIHPEGGGGAVKSLERLIERLEDADFRALLDYATERGLNIEYEFHAFGYLLSRDLFSTHPEYFVMNENGERTPDLNFCPSSKEALDIVANEAVKLVKKLYGSSHRYFLWSDDVRAGGCHCPACRCLSASDQQLTVLNAMVRAIRAEIPDATLAYLAYYDTLDAPSKVDVEEGIFLEFAPIDKWHIRQGRNTPEFVSGYEKEKQASEGLFKYFGKSGSRVLEYWIDNSLFSWWKKPPVKLVCDGEKTYLDIKEYLDEGYEDISTFGCFLGDDYEALYGEPDISPFTEAIKRNRK